VVFWSVTMHFGIFFGMKALRSKKACARPSRIDLTSPGAGNAPLAQNRLEDEQQVQIERAQIHPRHTFHAFPFAISALLQPAAKAYKTARPSAAAVSPSPEALDQLVRAASAMRITMSVRKSITLLMLLLSVSAAPLTQPMSLAGAWPTRLGRR
jgi:hypothetical protein